MTDLTGKFSHHREYGRGHPGEQRDDDEFGLRAATAALYIVVLVVVHLGYFLGVKLCVLRPVKRLRYLGMIMDSGLQSFVILGDKKVKFSQLRSEILTVKTIVPVSDMQRIMRKCMFLSLEFLGAMFYIPAPPVADNKALLAPTAHSFNPFTAINAIHTYRFYSF